VPTSTAVEMQTWDIRLSYRVVPKNNVNINIHGWAEDMELERRWVEFVSESGRTDITAAARLFRFSVAERSILPLLIREEKEDRLSSASEITLQSSLPRCDPNES